MKDTKEKIVCLKCTYFYVTWDKGFPNGCKAMGFKSKDLPSLVVNQCSGMPCQQYEPKT
jgi:hypothetical protein